MTKGYYWRCVKCHYAHDQDYCPDCGYHTKEQEDFRTQRKPLTDEQIRKASLEAGMQEHYMDFNSGFIRFAKAIEAAHGIKS